jgi:serine-type D-Ala-D-Ala carboxypeptidase/endopeptidase (penicillin-binding protein 4)
MQNLIRCAHTLRPENRSVCHSRESGNPARSTKQMLWCLLALWIPAFAGMTSHAHAQNIEDLRHDLDSLFHNSEFSNATFGVAIQSLKTGEYLYRLNDTKSLVPASNMKLFTTAEALATLGLDYRFKTTFEVDETDRHVFVLSSGDPSFCAAVQFGDTERFDSIRSIAKELKQSHIDTIRLLTVQGADDTYDITSLYPEGWEVEDIWEDYAPEVRSLNFDENQIKLTVSPSDTVGGHARITFDSTNFGFFNANNYQTVTVLNDSEATIEFRPDFLHNMVYVSGRIPYHGKPVVEHVAVHGAGLFAANAIRGIFERSGIHISAIDGKTYQLQQVEQFDYLDWQNLVCYSPPLSNLVRTMNKESDNLYAECLAQKQALIRGKGDIDLGVTETKMYLDSIGIDTSQLQFTDGSGLSRMDLVTADAIVKLLHVMSLDSKLDSAFYNSLPIMGVDGTLENRLKNTPAMGNVHAKTGSMTGVRSISGYLTTQDGEPIAFSILANNYTCPGSEIGKLEDEVLLNLVNFSRAR